MSREYGQALAEYTLLLAILVAALCLPLFGEQAVVVHLETSLRQFWQAWCTSLLSLEFVP